MDKQKISVKKSLTCKEAVAYMQALVDSLESGKIVVESGEERVTLTPSKHIDIEVEAKTKKNKQKFGFEISWSNQDDAQLKISDGEPEAERIPEKTGKEEEKPEAKVVKKEKKAKKETQGKSRAKSRKK